MAGQRGAAESPRRLILEGSRTELHPQRLINAGVSAETLKVVMRHADFATTEKHYGAMRLAQAAASEVRQKLAPDATSDAFVGGDEKVSQLSAADLSTLKRLLASI